MSDTLTEKQKLKKQQQERIAKALRDNLRRRKQAARKKNQAKLPTSK